MSLRPDTHASAFPAPCDEFIDIDKPNGRPVRHSVMPRPSLPPKPARRKPTKRALAKGKQRAQTARKPRAPRPMTVRKADATPLWAKQLLADYEPLVRQIAGGFQRKLPCNVLRDDLIAAGMSGLWDAIRRHDDPPAEGFEWYVRVRIRGAILDELRAQDWLPRRARAAATKAAATASVAPPSVVRIDDVSEWEQGRCLSTSELSSSEAALDAKFTSQSLARAVEQLPERERHIVSSHYFRGVKFKQLGAELGVSEPRISQLHSRAMTMLKTLMDTAA